jgi:hypothetical protein
MNILGSINAPEFGTWQFTRHHTTLKIMNRVDSTHYVLVSHVTGRELLSFTVYLCPFFNYELDRWPLRMP